MAEAIVADATPGGADREDAMNRRRFRIPPWSLLIVPLMMTGCSDRSRPQPEATLGWMEGEWQGIRRSADDGREDSMFVLVVPLTGGPGNIERLRVETGESSYIGFAVRSPSEAEGRWTMLYANATRDRISRLEGEVGPGRATWQSADPRRPRISKVEMERLDTNRWRRTNRVSEDSGKSWRLLFTDEVERKR